MGRLMNLGLRGMELGYWMGRMIDCLNLFVYKDSISIIIVHLLIYSIGSLYKRFHVISCLNITTLNQISPKLPSH
jgi:hypothetical protein